MRISDWSSDVCSSDLILNLNRSSQFVIGCHWIIEDGTASGVAAEKCALRPFQHLHRIEVVGGDAACQVGAGHIREIAEDRKSVVQGKSVSGRVDLGARRYIKKKNTVNTSR